MPRSHCFILLYYLFLFTDSPPVSSVLPSDFSAVEANMDQSLISKGSADLCFEGYNYSGLTLLLSRLLNSNVICLYSESCSSSEPVSIYAEHAIRHRTPLIIIFVNKSEICNQQLIWYRASIFHGQAVIMQGCYCTCCCQSASNYSYGAGTGAHVRGGMKYSLSLSRALPISAPPCKETETHYKSFLHC